MIMEYLFNDDNKQKIIDELNKRHKQNTDK